MKKEKIEIFKILRYISLSVILIFGLMTIVGTGGGGGDGDDDDDGPAPPSFNATGTWSTEAIKMYDSDGESIGEIEQGTMTVTQTNNSITIETDDGDTFTGTVSGAIYTFSGDLGEIQEPGGQWGTATVEGTFELTSETSLFGDYTFEWTDGSHIHTEEWDFTGTKQDGPTLPVAGEWGGISGFGEIELVVTPDSTGIESIGIIFDDFRCGNIITNGSITFTGSWAISNGQFTADLDWTTTAGDREMNIMGTFDDSGTYVSGTYEADYDGTICAGIWEASPE